MTRAVEGVVGIVVLAAASATPIVVHAVGPGRIVVSAAIVLVGVGYAAALSRLSIPGRALPAAVTAGAAAALGAAGWPNPVVAGVAWLLAFAVAWSIARRRSIGVVGTVVAAYVVGAGVVATIFTVGGAPLSYSATDPWDTARVLVAIGWSVLAGVHGAMRASELSRAAVRRWWLRHRGRSPEEAPPQHRE